jgi:two-component system NtrC family sensor kinase
VAKNPVDIIEVVETTLRVASFDKSFQNLELQKSYEENLPKVMADPDQLQQVFLNLFLNARDAMPASGGVFKIKISKLLNEIRIELSDNGNGIEEQNLKKIFDPFFTTKLTGQGTGLGLAVCYGIITAHGGKIEVTSDILNGTSFIIFLPAEESAEQNGYPLGLSI